MLQTLKSRLANIRPLLTNTKTLVCIISIFTALAYLTIDLLAHNADTASTLRHAENSGTTAPIMPPVTFGAASLIIPMDTGTSGQNNGMLRAYGLVYELLRNNIPVNWVIEPSKATNGDDFVINVAGVVQDVRTGSTVTTPRSYRGGPFVIAASDTAAALPIVLAWQSTPGDATAVHRLIGAGSITPNVSRVLVRAPRIAVIKDGNETIAFNNLNAAGIRDAAGALWSAASPDQPTEAEIIGPTTSDNADGVLFYAPGGLTRYGHLISLHYIVTGNTPEAVQETRSWLTSDALTSAFMQCESSRVFENDAGGLFLTTAGIADDGTAPVAPTLRVPSDPLIQVDGTFQVDSGSVDSIGLAGGSTFRAGVTTLINESAASLTQRIVMLKGNIDGNPGLGKVTYLAGHDYSLSLPISSNPQTNGIRLFLNSIFESAVTTDAGQADVAITKSGPAFANTNSIAYTINYSNPGPRPVENLKIIDTLPVGATYLAGSGVPAPTTNSGGVLTWSLPPLASGGAGSVSFSVTVTSDGNYTNRSQVQFSNLAVRTVSSNAVITTRDTIAPIVDIPGDPINPSTTNDATPTLVFSVTGATGTLCRFDSDSFVPCASPFTATGSLADGPHIFEVRGVDDAGNIGSDTYIFTVDSTPTAVSGTVTYGNAAVPPKYISNVTITGAGSPIVSTTTAPPGATAGQYSLSGFGLGSYVVTPTKTEGQNNAINSFDAARVAQHVTGISILTGNAFLSADVSNNGGVSSFDAAEIANFTVSSSPVGIAGTWKFIPVSKSYASIITDITAEDYVGLLMGEVSGNWNNTGARPAEAVNSEQWTVDRKGIGSDRDFAVELPSFVSVYGKEMVVPVHVQGIAKKGVISYEFELRYDPLVMQPAGDGVDVKGTVSRGLSVVTNTTEPGHLRVVVYGAYPIDGDGVLLNLRFTAVGGVGSVSPISFERIMFNEGGSRVSVTDGKIELVGS